MNLKNTRGKKKPTKMIFEVNPCVKYLSTLSPFMPLTLRKNHQCYRGCRNFAWKLECYDLLLAALFRQQTGTLRTPTVLLTQLPRTGTSLYHCTQHSGGCFLKSCRHVQREFILLFSFGFTQWCSVCTGLDSLGRHYQGGEGVP